MSIWVRAHRKHLERRALNGDWKNLIPGHESAPRGECFLLCHNSKETELLVRSVSLCSYLGLWSRASEQSYLCMPLERHTISQTKALLSQSSPKACPSRYMPAIGWEGICPTSHVVSDFNIRPICEANSFCKVNYGSGRARLKTGCQSF